MTNDPADTLPKLRVDLARICPPSIRSRSLLSAVAIGIILGGAKAAAELACAADFRGRRHRTCRAVGSDVETIGSRFGAIQSGLPAPSLPSFSLEKIRAVLPDAFAIAILGAIESLLSAVVADSMSGRRHRSNSELVAQGVGNIAAAACGGMPVTGTIARTATNIRAGARGPVAGMLHSLYLLIFVLVAMPLVAYIPLAALAGVLVVVAWAMADKAEFGLLLRTSRADALVLLSTFLLTVFVDLLTGIGVGVLLGSFLFMHRMAEAIDVEGAKLVREDVADSANGRPAYEGLSADDVMVYRISGAFFFGATARVNLILDRVVHPPRVFILDFSEVPFIDITASAALERFVRRLHKAGTEVDLRGRAAARAARLRTARLARAFCALCFER